MNNIGRNDPCPCGSGKKYKKCCLEADVLTTAQSNPASQVNQELSKAFAGQQFESLDDMQVFAEHKIQQMNEAPRDELGGFSPSQLHTLLNYPLEEQQLIRWQSTISNQALNAAPVWVVFDALRTYLSEHNAKATAKGNLPRALVKFVLDQYVERFDTDFRLERVNKEEDFRELNITRLVLELAGLIRLHKGHFTLTKKALSLTDSELFKLLLTTYQEKYNWAYEDLYPELNFIQSAGWYSLVALHRLNGQAINKMAFAEDFVRVFPMLLDEAEGNAYKSPQDCITNSYSIRTIERFWEFFGFVRLEGEIFTQGYRKTMVTMPLLHQIFVFPQE
ncbi:SEC-C metal-binding domain-containing protein [Gilvimarinus sp. SDUM040013]|uniref:SEC-C metal-binding domain-containing protein n=1 Tax=Gilvimarinus gilvus TaxID=3058038 RepID=A0ABU4RZV7_9GAMM|nr:SEC-C metal-binding domain-containing protein [Gilvimarinus sp. SDUM040013]MDO3384774.1 SEC-C metal-binding domain-containing protein [Gilvimarinus sp. SDUM040013]MDX6850408.1 SEC-C metal-binding domain-containing protein [Gilvimarinus sp. SDUM040013]